MSTSNSPDRPSCSALAPSGSSSTTRTFPTRAWVPEGGLRDSSSDMLLPPVQQRACRRHALERWLLHHLYTSEDVPVKPFHKASSAKPSSGLRSWQKVTVRQEGAVPETRTGPPCTSLPERNRASSLRGPACRT